MARPPPVPSADPSAAEPPASSGPQNSAFDLWLDRGLHRLFDTIAQEPVPDSLLQIIEQDRTKG